MKRLIVLLVVAGLAAAIRYLPWWASLALLVAVPALGWFVAKRVITRFFLRAFELKSRVLRGARVRIRAIEPAPPVKPLSDGDEDGDADFEGLEDPHHWVYIDLDVIVPERSDTPMSHWDPSELAIVAENADPKDWNSDEAVARIHHVEVMRDGAWVGLDEKLCGSARLRLHVAAREGVDRFRLRYYFELLKPAA